jgi:hypothetical protein
MFVYNVGFVNTLGENDETQLDIAEQNDDYAEVLELMNLILSLKDEMGIKEITYIECVGLEEEEE